MKHDDNKLDSFIEQSGWIGDGGIKLAEAQDMTTIAKAYADHMLSEQSKRIAELEEALQQLHSRYEACKFYELDMSDIDDDRVDGLALTQCFAPHPLLKGEG